MSENDVTPEIPQDQQETNHNGRVRMDTQVGNAHEASSLSNDQLVDHSSEIFSKVEALSLSEANEYSEFMHKLSAIESKKTGNDALDRNRVRRPREKLFQDFFRTHNDLHSQLTIRIAAENKSFRDALLAKRIEKVIESNPFLINSHAPQTKDGWTIDKALIKIQEFELLLKEIQQLETPDIPLVKIRLNEHSLKRVRDMRYTLREKLRVVDPEGVRQWIMVTADADAPARIEAARNKQKEPVATHQAETAQNERVQQTVPPAENIVSSTQEVRHLMHKIGRETTASVTNSVSQTDDLAYPTYEQESSVSHSVVDTDIRHKLSQASRSDLSERLKKGSADPLSLLGDPLNPPQQSGAQDVRESLQKLSATNLTDRINRGHPEPLQTVESTPSVSDEVKIGGKLRERLSSSSASHLTQRLEQGPQLPIDRTSLHLHDLAPSQPVRGNMPPETPRTDAIRVRAEQQIADKRENIQTAISKMFHSHDPHQVAKNARSSGNNGIAGFAASTVLNTEAHAIANARRDARSSSTAEQRAQTSKAGGFLKKLFGLRR